LPTATMARATVSVPEAGRIIGLSRTGSYAAARRGDLPTVRVGRKLVVPVYRLLAMLDGEREKDTSP